MLFALSKSLFPHRSRAEQCDLDLDAVVAFQAEAFDKLQKHKTVSNVGRGLRLHLTRDDDDETWTNPLSQVDSQEVWIRLYHKTYAGLGDMKLQDIQV
jgi:hypothetical protein